MQREQPLRRTPLPEGTWAQPAGLWGREQIGQRGGPRPSRGCPGQCSPLILPMWGGVGTGEARIWASDKPAGPLPWAMSRLGGLSLQVQAWSWFSNRLITLPTSTGGVHVRDLSQAQRREPVPLVGRCWHLLCARMLPGDTNWGSCGVQTIMVPPSWNWGPAVSLSQGMTHIFLGKSSG